MIPPDFHDPPPGPGQSVLSMAFMLSGLMADGQQPAFPARPVFSLLLWLSLPGLSFPYCFDFPCLIRLSYLRPIRFSSLCMIPLSLPDIKIRAENLEKCQKIQVCACPDDRNI